MGDFRPLFFKVIIQMTSPVKSFGHLWTYIIFSLLRLGVRKFIQMVSFRLPRWPPCPYWASVSLVHMITLVSQESNTGPSWSSWFCKVWQYLHFCFGTNGIVQMSEYEEQSLDINLLFILDSFCVYHKFWVILTTLILSFRYPHLSCSWNSCLFNFLVFHPWCY